MITKEQLDNLQKFLTWFIIIIIIVMSFQLGKWIGYRDAAFLYGEHIDELMINYSCYPTDFGRPVYMIGFENLSFVR